MYRRRRQIGASGIYSSCWTFTVVCRYLLKSNALKCILFWLLRNSTNNGNLNYFHNYSSTLRSGSVKSELPFKVDWKWSVEDNNLGWLGELLAKQAKRNFILQHSPVIYTWLIPTLHPNRLITNNSWITDLTPSLHNSTGPSKKSPVIFLLSFLKKFTTM